MAQGNYDTITLLSCVSSCKIALKIETSDADIWLEKLANEAIRHLDALSINTKQICKVDIVDGRSELPCGFGKLIGLRVSSPTLNGETCQSLVYANLPFLTECGCDTNSQQGWFMPAFGAFEIADGHIWYHAIASSYQYVDANGITQTVNTTPTEATIAFTGLNVNAEGEMICYARYERAITAYLCYRYAQQNFNEYPAAIREGFHEEWKAQKKWIKSTDFQDNFRNEKPQIVATVACLISDQTMYAL